VWVSDEQRAARWKLGYQTFPEMVMTYQVPDCHTEAGLHKLTSLLALFSEYAVPHQATKEVLIGMESFDFRHAERSRDKIDYTAPEVIGAVREWQLSRQHVELRRTPAALGKGFWNNEKLQRAEMYKKSFPHGMDALRHLLRFFTFEYGDESISKGLFEKIRLTTEVEDHEGSI
jgi:hypothetical protein